MEAKVIIGIDFSKDTFDVSVLFSINEVKNAPHMAFGNDSQGYKQMLDWVKSLTKVKRSEWLFCGENTGVYSYDLSVMLAKKGLFMWLEDPMQINRCSGVRLDKTDEKDSLSIAEYAFRFIDRAKRFMPKSKTMEDIELYMNQRQSLVSIVVELQNENTSLSSSSRTSAAKTKIINNNKSAIAKFRKQIAHYEKEIERLIKSESSLSENYKRVKSVKGVGICIATAVLTYTDNFRKCNNPRQFAVYAGVVPHKHESGTSIKWGEHTRKRCNRKLRVLLTQGAQSAAMYDPEMKAYMQRMLARGKEYNLVINNIRYKLIKRIFAVIKNGRDYIVGADNYGMAKMMAKETMNQKNKNNNYIA